MPASGLDHGVGAGTLEALSRWEMGWPGAAWLSGDTEMGPKQGEGAAAEHQAGGGTGRSLRAGRVWTFSAMDQRGQGSSRVDGVRAGEAGGGREGPKAMGEAGFYRKHTGNPRKGSDQGRAASGFYLERIGVAAVGAWAPRGRRARWKFFWGVGGNGGSGNLIGCIFVELGAFKAEVTRPRP